MRDEKARFYRELNLDKPTKKLLYDYQKFIKKMRNDRQINTRRT